MNRFTTLILLIFLASSCSVNKRTLTTTPVITPLKGQTSVKDGSLIYGLPLTVLDVFIETERVIEIPGPYSRYAGELLGLSDVIDEEIEYWTIKSISITTHEELDPSEFYIIESDNSIEINALALKRAGLILDLNPQIYNNVYDRNKSRAEESEPGFEPLRILDLGADEYYLAQRDTAYRIVSLDTGFVRIPYLVEKKRRLPMDQLAERAARRLMELRDGKHLILTGEANVFPQSEDAIKEINRLEKEYTELFTGKEWKETRTFTYQVIPRKEMTGNPVTILRFSETTGPISTTDNSGIPVMIDFSPEMKTKDLSMITRSPADPASALYDKLYYRVPDVVNIKILWGNEILNSSRRLIYQFGELVQLPGNYIIGTY